MRMPSTVIRGADGKVMRTIRARWTWRYSQLDVALKELIAQIDKK
jgi:hypothetical protein